MTKKKKRRNRKDRKNRRKLVLLIAGAIVAAAVLEICVMIALLLYRGHLKDSPPVEDDRISVSGPDIMEEFLTPNKNSRPQMALGYVNGIVIHYTANPGTSAMANRDYFESRKDKKDMLKNKVSSHFIIGLKGEIIQCIPLDEIAYASNERNMDTISIECCHPDRSGKFNKKTYRSLIHLCAWLCDKYDIASKEAIIRHYDVTGKKCPKYYVKHEDEWEELRSSIWEKYMRASDHSG